MKVLVTGAAGYLGGKILDRLARGTKVDVVAVDVRGVGPRSSVTYREMDVRDPALSELVAEHGIEAVVHLAAIVNPGRNSRRELEYSVDVGGTENVVRACLANGVRRLVVTSSGAAYGYHPDHPEWLTEEMPLRGNVEFPYSWHKRLVEERLARLRDEEPKLEQVVFRVGTILGAGVENQITHFFEKPRLVGIRGGDHRFVFVWDEDVAACLERALHSEVTGVFNVAGDGALGMDEMAARMGKPFVELPAALVRWGLRLGKPLGLTRYGPEQVRFLQYRPVLSNRRLKEVFGYVPEKTSSEVFDLYLASRRGG